MVSYQYGWPQNVLFQSQPQAIILAIIVSLMTRATALLLPQTE